MLMTATVVLFIYKEASDLSAIAKGTSVGADAIPGLPGEGPRIDGGLLDNNHLPGSYSSLEQGYIDNNHDRDDRKNTYRYNGIHFLL